MGIGAGLHMYAVIVKKSSRSLSDLLMGSCNITAQRDKPYKMTTISLLRYLQQFHLAS